MEHGQSGSRTRHPTVDGRLPGELSFHRWLEGAVLNEKNCFFLVVSLLRRNALHGREAFGKHDHRARERSSRVETSHSSSNQRFRPADQRCSPTQLVLLLRLREKSRLFPVSAVYDITVAFQSPRSPELANLLLGQSCKAEAFIRRIPIDQVPVDDEEKSAQFVHRLFQEKVKKTSKRSEGSFGRLSRIGSLITSRRMEHSPGQEILRRRI